MENKKKLMIAGASALGLGILGVGAFAYFNDTATLTGDAKVGTVDVEVTGGLTHSNGLNNLNPGDNDPEVPDSYRDGTDHEFTFSISNEGTKSIMTRSVLRVYGTYQYNVYYTDAQGNYTDADGNPLAEGEDPVVKEVKTANLTEADLRNIIVSERATATDAVSANDDDKDVEVSDGVKTVVPLTTGVMDNEKLVYIVGGTRGMQDVLDGIGEGAETETGSAGTTLKKTFDIGLDKDVSATNSNLMGATIHIDVEVQAMQYRNTGDDAWETVFADTFTSNAG